MLAGDDEMSAILAEMGGGTTTEAPTGSTMSISTSKPKATPNKAHENVDFRLADDPRTEPWPPQFCLGKSFQEGMCAGWNQSHPEANDKCQDCQASRALHRLVVKEYTKKNKKKTSSPLLSWLFCHTRNIRCAASENIASCNAIMEESLQQLFQLLLLDNNKGAKQVLTRTDYSAIYEKAIAMRTIIQVRPLASTTPTNTADTRDDWRLQVLLHADRLYYRIYYAWLTTTATVTTMKIPHPPTYFSSPGLSWKVSTDDAHEFCQALTPAVRDLLVNTMGLFQDDSSIINPLHVLWQHRFYEMIRHFWKRSTPQSNSIKAVESRPDHLQPEFAIHETLSPCPLLAEWRDVARDFPASLYAYATPSPRALETIIRHIFDDDGDNAPCRRLVEVGAGTGYWAALLKQYLQQNNSSQNQTVQPFDLCPPGTFSENDYHSEVPAFTTVQQSDATDMATNNNDALLLCYPPPGTDMAVSALRAFRGECIVHIGEWAGLTGNQAFEDLLIASFTCQTNLAIPAWGTDAAYLTIWKRRMIHHNNRDTPTTTVAIGTGGCLGCNGQRRATKRCRLARMIQYCSSECFESYKETRKSLLLLHMIDLQQDDKDLDWEDPQHFMSLQPTNHDQTKKNVHQGNVGDSDNAHQRKRRKRKHKTKHR